MVENSMEIARAGCPALASLSDDTPVVYGITAVRYEGTRLAAVLMGMLAEDMERWETRPMPTRLVEVVDRLVEGDTVISLFKNERGQLQAGPEVKVDVLAGGMETLALEEERAGQRLKDLPRF